jgi:SulP family sulfate permease
VGLGAANVAAALFSGYAVTGGFSRTAVNHQAGARSLLASVLAAALVLLTLLALTPLFTHLPNTVLAAVILVAVTGLIDAGEARRLLRVKKADGWTCLATFFITLFVGLDEGLLSGILLSLVLFVARSSRPRTVVLGRLAGRDEFHDLLRYPEARTDPRIIMIRVDASLYFANARFVEDRIRERLALQPDARWVLMDMSGVNDIDGVAVSTLGDLMEICAQRGVGFAFAGMKAQVRDVAFRAGWSEKVGARMDYPTLARALEALSVRERAGASPPRGAVREPGG